MSSKILSHQFIFTFDPLCMHLEDFSPWGVVLSAKCSEHFHLNAIFPCCESEFFSFDVKFISFGLDGFLSLFQSLHYHYNKIFHLLLFYLLLWKSNIILITQFIFLSSDILLSSLLLSDFLFLLKYIRLPIIITVPLIFSVNVWSSFFHNCCIISLFVLLKHFLHFKSPLRSSSL